MSEAVTRPPRTPALGRRGSARRWRWLGLALLLVAMACDRSSSPAASPSAAPEPRDEPSPTFRNVAQRTEYVGDSACAGCHARETAVYRQHGMAQSFHRWTAATRVETPLDEPLHNAPTGFSYSVVDSGGQLYQVERLSGPDGKRLHELRRRIDYVMGSGNVARTYFTEENGRLFQLPLTWYRQHGWDFSPGYEVNNGRFDRMLPDRCVACHASYPRTLPFLEGKYAELRDGIGCERCHGPGALHVQERRATASGTPRAGTFDNSIVNPARLPLERRLDTCEQCHVHTPVEVLREGKSVFSYVPSQPLRDQWAFFKVAGGIDVVSHADRLRQSACFIATRGTPKPLECATCHDPHQPPPDAATRNRPCQSCHQSAALAQRLARSPSRADHTPTADCVSCHMPRVQERTVPHGTFTEHWIRVVSPGAALPKVRKTGDRPIEPYYARDRTGADAPLYAGMGEIVYATLASNGRVLGDAAATLRRALGSDTGHAEPRFLLGVAYDQLGRSDDAIQALEQSVHGDSSRPEALRALARAYARAGRPPASIDHLYRRALSVQPALAWLRAEYADFLETQGRVDDARDAYRLALDEQPDLAVAWFNLGTVLAGQGRLHEATDDFREAVHLDPSLAQGLSTLLQVGTTGRLVTGVRALGSPLPSLAVRERAPGALALSLASGVSAEVVLLNAPPNATVQILRPDGSLVRTLPTGADGSPRWNLLTDTGEPIGGGLYRARLLARDASGRLRPSPLLSFGIVRQRM